MKTIRLLIESCLFAMLGMAPLCGSWQGLVRWEGTGGWQYVDLNLAFDAGQNWKYLPEADVWIYVFDPAEPVPEGFWEIPAGTFTMGSPVGEPGRTSDETQHTVTLTRAFYLQQAEVYKMQWDQGRAEGAAHGYTDLPVGTSGVNGNEHIFLPVTEVSWLDAVKWLNLMSELEGLTPCYKVGGAVLRTGTSIPTCDFSAKGYRLPTESEWEYACRAGTATAFHSGPITYTGDSPLDPNLNLIGWYAGNSDGSPQIAVSGKQANAWGLTDMSGNVSEWCWDLYGEYAGTVTDPTGATSGSNRIQRGGHFASFAQECRSASRVASSPDTRSVGIGFRPARNK